jgi:hypothetical protein
MNEEYKIKLTTLGIEQNICFKECVTELGGLLAMSYGAEYSCS